MEPQDDKELIREAVKEVLNEMAVTYANGAVKFANTLTDSWSGVINAFDGFFLSNFIEDQPEAAQGILEARLSAARRARDLITKKIRDLERQVMPRTTQEKQARSRTSRQP